MLPQKSFCLKLVCFLQSWNLMVQEFENRNTNKETSLCLLTPHCIKRKGGKKPHGHRVRRSSTANLQILVNISSLEEAQRHRTLKALRRAYYESLHCARARRLSEKPGPFTPSAPPKKFYGGA